jgi:hypothetical protein
MMDIEHIKWLFENVGPQGLHRPRFTRPLEIEVTDLEGHPVHVEHETARDHSFHDRAIEKLGPLGYGLLRAAVFESSGYRYERFGDLIRRLEEADVQAKAWARAGYGSEERVVADLRRPLIWELMGLTAEMAEWLATMFSAVRRYNDGDDIGRALLGNSGPAHRVIQSTDFGNLEWWYRQLDLWPGNPARNALGAMEMWNLDLVNREVRARVEQAITEIRAIYNEPLHRVAQRFKHGYPLLDRDIGIEWRPEDPDRAETLRRLHESGALFVVDLPPRNRAPVQMVVPTDARTSEALKTAIIQSLWLADCLADSVIQRAENLTGAVIVVDPYGPTRRDPELFARILSIYGGRGDEGAAEDLALLEAHRERQRKYETALMEVRAETATATAKEE